MENQGILQAQINIKNKIDLNNAFSSDTIQNPLLKSIEGNLNLKDKNSLVHFNGGNNATQHIDPIIYEDSDELDITNALNNNASVKYLKIDANVDPSVTSKFANNSDLEKIDSIFPIESGVSAFENTNLKQIPNVTFNNPDQSSVLTNDTNLAPTTLDFSDKDNMTRLGVYGEESDEISNLQFVKVSTEAPFDGDSPQIKVDYTGLDQNGLVNLFNIMPYNVGYTVVGTPTIVDGVVSGFSADDYLYISNQVDWKQVTDIVFKIRIPSSALGTNSYSNITYCGLALFTYSGSTKFQYTGFNANGMGDLFINKDLDADTWYWIKYSSDGTTSTASWSTNGINYTAGQSKQTSTITSNPGGITIGKRSTNRIFPGEIDLNQTYIKINSPISTGPVTYTKVGSPTISNGVASDFSTSAYLKLNNPISAPNNTPFEINAKFNASSVTANNKTILAAFNNDWTSYMFVRILADSRFQFLTRKADLSGFNTQFLTPSAISMNTDYVFNAKYDGTTLTQVLTSNGSVVHSQTQTATIYLNPSGGGNSNTTIGAQLSQYGAGVPWVGSIDLNQTYIKVNGKLWFGHESKQVTWFNGTNAVNQRQLSSDLTVVGNPTISNGVASGFSVDNYLETASIASGVNTIDFNIKFTLANTFQYGNIFGYNTSAAGISNLQAGLNLSSNYLLRFYLFRKSDNTIPIFTFDQFRVNQHLGETFTANCFTDKSNVIINLYDNLGNLVDSGTWNNQDLVGDITSKILIGRGMSTNTPGGVSSIDLNQTYIKINGSVWMHGTDPMTKTCSIIGCTGTSSLTADDKAIATGKGWILKISN